MFGSREYREWKQKRERLMHYVEALIITVIATGFLYLIEWI